MARNEYLLFHTTIIQISLWMSCVIKVNLASYCAFLYPTHCISCTTNCFSWDWNISLHLLVCVYVCLAYCNFTGGQNVFTAQFGEASWSDSWWTDLSNWKAITRWDAKLLPATAKISSGLHPTFFIQDSVKQHFSPQPNSPLYRRVIFCVQSHYEVGYAPQCCAILRLTVKRRLMTLMQYHD